MGHAQVYWGRVGVTVRGKASLDGEMVPSGGKEGGTAGFGTKERGDWRR